MRISVKTDIKKAVRKLNRIQRRQIPFATAKALSDTAEFAAVNLNDDTRQYLDRPTPFTQRSFTFKRATKRNLTALVMARKIQDQYIAFQVFGGTRRPKNVAQPLPVNIRLNRFGNMPRRKVSTLAARSDTFSGTLNGVAGLWQRTRQGTKLLVAYEPVTKYNKQFPFFRLTDRYARRAFPPFFDRALRRALATAR